MNITLKVKINLLEKKKRQNCEAKPDNGQTETNDCYNRESKGVDLVNDVTLTLNILKFKERQ